MNGPQPNTITIEPHSTLEPGDTDVINLGQVTAGPRNQEGYLRKFMPFEAVVADSYSGAVRVEVSTSGTEYTPVPTNSARTFDSKPVNALYIRNPAGSGANVDPSDFKLILYLTEGEVARRSQEGFSAGKFLQDLIPGFSSGVRTDR